MHVPISNGNYLVLKVTSFPIPASNHILNNKFLLPFVFLHQPNKAALYKTNNLFARQLHTINFYQAAHHATLNETLLLNSNKFSLQLREHLQEYSLFKLSGEP